MILCVGYIAGVEESAGVLGVGGDPGCELGLGSLPVGFGNSGLGVEDLLGHGLGCGGGGGRR
jgi:hypothetical protein